MFYVYSQHIKSGRQDFINAYDSADEAVRKIRQCYNIDEKLCQLGEYYYFMKQR